MSRLIRYGRIPCLCCGKMISTNGMGFNSHMRAHVRRGEAKQELTAANFYTYTPIPKPAALQFVDTVRNLISEQTGLKNDL